MQLADFSWSLYLARGYESDQEYVADGFNGCEVAPAGDRLRIIVLSGTGELRNECAGQQKECWAVNSNFKGSDEGIAHH